MNLLEVVENVDLLQLPSRVASPLLAVELNAQLLAMDILLTVEVFANHATKQ